MANPGWPPSQLFSKTLRAMTTRRAFLSSIAGGFEIVVRDRERTGSVPPADGLRILPHQLDVGNIGAGHRGGRAVERDAALLSFLGVAMDVETIDDEALAGSVKLPVKVTPGASAIVSSATHC